MPPARRAGLASTQNLLFSLSASRFTWKTGKLLVGCRLLERPRPHKLCVLDYYGVRTSLVSKPLMNLHKTATDNNKNLASGQWHKFQKTQLIGSRRLWAIQYHAAGAVSAALRRRSPPANRRAFPGGRPLAVCRIVGRPCVPRPPPSASPSPITSAGHASAADESLVASRMWPMSACACACLYFRPGLLLWTGSAYWAGR